MYFYLVTISYSGSDFQGWAKQPNEFTAQGYIEKALKKIFCFPIKILASSRTDKGVSAREQNFILKLTFFLTKKKLLSVLKKNLLPLVLTKRIKKVDNNFHPLRNIVSKEYRYFIGTGKINVWKSKIQWEYNKPLETRKLNNILKIFQGKHDFFNYCFCRKKNQSKTNTIKQINFIKTWKKKDLVVIKFVAQGFLRYQIRAIIGETINCYEEKQTIDNLKKKLIDTNSFKNKYKKIAPASGLFLWKTEYS